LSSDDVGATAYFPAGFTGSSTLPPSVDSPTWVPVGTPGAPQYVTATDLYTPAAGTGPSVIVAADSPPSSQQPQPQQVPGQPMHVLQPYPQHVSVMPAAPPPPPTLPPHPAQPTPGYLQHPAPTHLQVCISYLSFLSIFHSFYYAA